MWRTASHIKIESHRWHPRYTQGLQTLTWHLSKFNTKIRQQNSPPQFTSLFKYAASAVTRVPLRSRARPPRFIKPRRSVWRSYYSLFRSSDKSDSSFSDETIGISKRSSTSLEVILSRRCNASSLAIACDTNLLRWSDGISFSNSAAISLSIMKFILRVI